MQVGGFLCDDLEVLRSGAHVFTGSLNERFQGVAIGPDATAVVVGHFSETFDAKAWRAHHGPEALPLFRLQPDGDLKVVTAEDEPAPLAGEILVGIVPAENTQREMPN